MTNYFSSMKDYLTSNMTYEVFVGDLPLPLPPKKLTITRNNGNRRAVLVDGGEVNILKDPELSDIEFDAIIPQGNHIPQGGILQKVRSAANSVINMNKITKLIGAFTHVQTITTSAELVEKYFEYLREMKCVFPFIVYRSFPNIPLSYALPVNYSVQVVSTARYTTNIPVCLSSYSTIDTVEEGKDVIFSISLKQYKHKGAKSLKEITEKKADGTTSTHYEVNKEADSPDMLRMRFDTTKSRTTLNSVAKIHDISTMTIIALNPILYAKYGLDSPIQEGTRVYYGYF